VAWLPQGRRAQLAPLLTWLGVDQAVEHAQDGLGSVAVLDLPDLDSIAPEHRAKVDELLPRVDAVAWVVDPEKYHDAALHDDYLRRWMPRLGRQVAVLTKADRLSSADAQRLKQDLAATLAREAGANVDVLLASGRDGAAGTQEVREWLAGGAEAKRIVAQRLVADAASQVALLATRAGVDPERPSLVDPQARERVLADVRREALSIVDVPGVERQAVAATRLAARPSGGGPMGHITSRIYRYSGRQAVAADPAGYLRRWRDRGSLTRAAEPVRQLVTDRLTRVPAQARPGLAELAEPARLQSRLGEIVDASVAATVATLKPPKSRAWPVIGLGQYLIVGLLLFAVLWFVTLWLGAGSVDDVVLPGLGRVPTPAVFLAAVLLIGYLLARALGWHAGLVGRRWAGRVRNTLTGQLERRLEDGLLGPLDALDAARGRLATAASGAGRDCRPEVALAAEPAAGARAPRTERGGAPVPTT
jgi:hypothetical protein